MIFFVNRTIYNNCIYIMLSLSLSLSIHIYNTNTYYIVIESESHGAESLECGSKNVNYLNSWKYKHFILNWTLYPYSSSLQTFLSHSIPISNLPYHRIRYKIHFVSDTNHSTSHSMLLNISTSQHHAKLSPNASLLSKSTPSSQSIVHL